MKNNTRTKTILRMASFQTEEESGRGLHPYELSKLENCKGKNKLCQIIGSDAHNNKNRNFMLKNAYEECYKIVGEEAYKWVYYNPKKL